MLTLLPPLSRWCITTRPATLENKPYFNRENLTMSHTASLTRAEIESMGPPLPMEIADTGISEQFLCDLALKHVAMLPEPTTQAVAERINLPRTLTEDLLQ